MSESNQAEVTNLETVPGVRRTVFVVVGIIVLVLTLFVYVMSTDRVLSLKDVVSNGAIVYEQPRDIREFNLIAHTGEPFTNESFKGQWSLVFFGFASCPGFCPATLSMLDSFYEVIDADIREQTQVVMISVDPARDTPEALAEYVPKFNENFIGVTGKFLPIKLLSDEFYIAFQKEFLEGGDDYTINHGEQILLVDPDGKYHGFFKPPFELARLKLTYQSIIRAGY